MLYDCFHAPLMQDLNFSATREYLVAAASGAWSASTISGCNTRKYHGLMVMPQSFPGDDNYVLLSSLDDTFACNEESTDLFFHYYADTCPPAQKQLLAFTANPLPQWWYQIQDEVIVKELLMDADGTLMIRYTRIIGQHPVNLRLRPLLAFRNMHCLTFQNGHANTAVTELQDGIGMKLYGGYSELFMQVSAGSFVQEGYWYKNIEYPSEKQRGYDWKEDLYSPGYFDISLPPGESVIFAGSLHQQHMPSIQNRFSQLQHTTDRPITLKAHLLLAATQFLRDNSIKAGYYWFNNWGRDTFISLPGLTLVTGKIASFTQITRSWISQVKNGLLPNTGRDGTATYNSADAPLWLIWSIQQYAEKTHSWKEIWRNYGQILSNILDAYKHGTQYNIRMEEDGLITAGIPGTAVTWMDAVTDGEPVTPRTGKAVDINALWYNAVCFCLKVALYAKDNAFTDSWEGYPEMIAKSFSATFWNEEKRYLADVVHKDIKDWSVRPNQLFAVSLPFSPLAPAQQRAVMSKIKSDLLTPRGLRTLSPSDPAYNPTYQGDQHARDRSYHQGTVWPWLLAHFAEGLLRTEGPVVLPFLDKIYDGFKYVLDEYCLNTIPEIFDGDFPHTARGAVAQAWSVAELLRMEDLLAGFKSRSSTTLFSHHEETLQIWNLSLTNT